MDPASMRPSDITDGNLPEADATIPVFSSFNEAVGYYRRKLDTPAESAKIDPLLQ